MKCKIRLQGTASEVEAMRKYLLKFHPGLILGAPREGTNPKYDGEQKWSSYGDIEFTVTHPRFKKEEVKRKRKGQKNPKWKRPASNQYCPRCGLSRQWIEQKLEAVNTVQGWLLERK